MKGECSVAEEGRPPCSLMKSLLAGPGQKLCEPSAPMEERRSRARTRKRVRMTGNADSMSVRDNPCNPVVRQGRKVVWCKEE